MHVVERSRLLRKFMIFEGLWAIGLSGKDNRKLFWIVRAKTNSLKKMKSLNPLFEKNLRDWSPKREKEREG